MTVRDWRQVPPGVFATIFEAERSRWMRHLRWDTESNWSQVDIARQSGRLPGLVWVDDAGQIGGWTFFLPHHDALEIGALASTTPEMTAALLDGVLTSPEAARAHSLVLFAFSDSPALATQLDVRGFAVERYLYLSAHLPTAAVRGGRGVDAARPDPLRVGGVEDPHAPGAIRTYEHRIDARGVGALLGAAYGAGDPTRPFARSGRRDEWAEYLDQLVMATGCGAFCPGVSYVAPGVSPGRVEGATLMTRLADRTVHLAQLAITPESQGRGHAHRLLRASLEGARAQGFTHATLLVGERNARARRLYEGLGFEEAGAFVSAVRDQPRRSSSVAGGTGGVITLR